MENKKISSKILGSLLLLALACLMPMAMMAQQTHWTPVSAPYEDNMTLTGVIQINGTEQATTTLEVGAFCGTECRGAVRAVLFPATQRYVVMLTIFGNDGDQITFKLYDHNQGTELNYQSPAAVTFGPNGLGSLMDPYVLNFTSPSYTISASASPSAGGTVSGAGSYNYGTTCNLTATPATGYTFVRWTKNGTQVSTNASYSFTVTENASYVAVFSLNSYTISASASPSAGGTVSGAGSYNYGTTCNLTAMPATGYTFVRWTKNGTQVSTNASYSFTVTENASYVAVFSLNSYTISASASPSAGGTVSGAGSYQQGSTCSVSATANAGYTFDNWTENGTVVSAAATYTFEVTTSRTLVANFADATGTGKLSGVFSVGEHTHIQFSQGNLQYQASTNTWRFAEHQYDYVGNANNAISQTNSGWIDLFGWGTSGYNHGANAYQPWSTSTSSSDYYAYGNSGYNLYDQTGQADWGYNAISNGGNTTNTWRTLTGGSGGEWDYVFNTRSTTSGIRYAKAQVNGVNGVILLPDDWSASYYSLSNTNQGGASYTGNVISASQWNTLEEHGAVFLPAAGGRYGTSVNSVGSDGRYWSASYNYSDYAYDLLFYDSYLDPAYRYYRDLGQSVRLVRPAENYSFGINASPNPAEGGAVSGGGTYQEGATCTLTATPAEGYTFVNWTENGEVVSTEVAYSFTVIGDRNLVANFALQSYSISASASPSEGGTLSGMGSYNYSTTCTLTATPAEGYTFVNWTENGEVVSTEVAYSFTVIGDRELVANFTLQSYTISASASPSGGGTVSGGGTYNYGSTCNLIATPATGYSFVRWIKNGTQVSTDASYSFTVTENATYVAEFIIPTGDLVAYYPLDGDVNDYSGYGNHGAIIGNVVPATDRKGNPNGAYRFPGEPFNYISVPDAEVLHLNSFTLSAWVYTDADNYGSGYLVDKGRDINNGSYRLCVRNVGATTQYGGINDAGIDEDPAVNQWHMITGTVEGNQANFYLDGVLMDVKTLSQPFSCTNTDPLTLGMHYYTGVPSSYAYDLLGVLDDVRIYNRALSAQEVKNLYNSDNGCLPGVFSVSEDTQVSFSQGNLQWSATGGGTEATTHTVADGGTAEGTWRFAENQWDFVGNNSIGTVYANGEKCNNSNVSSTYSGWIDFFSWGTSGWSGGVSHYQPYSTSWNYGAHYPGGDWSNDLTGEYAYADWGVYNAINNGGNSPNLWRTLTSAEWEYIINTRTASSLNGVENARYALAKVNDINGLILFPDSYNHPEALTFPTAINVSESTVGWDNNSYTADEWMQMETAGAVFLPASGWSDVTSCYDVGVNGTYQSTTHYDSQKASKFGFNDSGVRVYPDNLPGRRSVRLVKNVQTATCSINVVPNPTEGGVIEGSGTYEPGTTCTLTATTNAGYIFVNWTENGEVVSTETTISFVVTGSRDIVANYNPMLTSISDDFNDGVINPELWTATGPNIYEEEGMIKIQQNRTDNYVALESLPFMMPTDSVIVMERRFLLHDQYHNSSWGDRYFYGNINIKINGSDDNYIGICYYDDDYENRHGTYIRTQINGEVNETRICDAIFDTWLTEGVILDFNENTLTYCRDFCSIVTVAIPNVRPDYVTFRFKPDGWWTGHYHNMDYIKINVEAPDNCSITVSTSPEEGGIATGGGEYEYLSVCTLIAEPNQGYDFMYWTDNGDQVSYDAECFFVVTPNRELVAHFTLPLTISATSDPAEGGMVSGMGEYEYNTTCMMTATPNEGYTFMYWTENGNQVSTSASYSFTVTTDRELVAHFMIKPVITVAINPAEGGTVSGMGEFDYNTTCTLMATPNPGYLFLNWSRNGSVVSSNATYSFTVTEDVNLEAVFSPLNGLSIGEGEAAIYYLPSYSLYNYTLSQQIYTPEEIGGSNTINSVAFFNAGGTKTRNYDIYLVHTDKTSFESNTDWIIVSETDRVFSGNLTFNTGQWTTINLDTPFNYDGISNLAIIVDDNSGNWSSNSMSCRVYNANGNQAIRVYSDGTNYDPYNPSSYGGTLHNVKNQVIFGMSHYTITAAASDAGMGTVAGGGQYDSGATCTLTANASGDNFFTSWTENGVIVSTEPTYTFTVTRNRSLVANFSTNHWTPIVGNQYNMTVTGVISINGVEQTSALLEVGAFCGEECRASEFAQYFPVTQQYVVTLTVRSRTLTGETITFRLYDHLQGRELDELQCVNTVTFENDANIGSIGNWFQFAFNSQVEISATVNPDGAGAVTGTGAYTLGTSATLVAEANEGFAFRDWSLNGEVVSTESTYTFVVTGATHLEANFDYVNTQDLVAGWNWWGTSVEVSGATGLEMIENSLGSNGISIKSQGQSTQNYYPETGYNYWFGSLQTLDIAQGYKINVSEGTQTVMTGAMADPSSHPVTITTEWSWVGYPVGVAQNLSAALSGFTPSANDVFKGQGKTSVYYEDYGWFPDFTLQPGNSYMYKSNDAENKTLVYSIGRSTAAGGEPEHHWQPIGGNQYNMSVTGVIVIDGVEQQSTALEVGAFCGDECRASEFAQYFPVTQQYVVTMTIRSNSASGETITFRLYDHNTGMEPYGVSPNSITFVTDAIVGSMNNWYQFAFVSSQTISTDLAQGWTWFAPTVQTSIEAIQTALGGAYVQILAKNGTPSGDIVPGEMYRIQTNAPCTLAVTGAPITTATIAINRGENWFGYVGTEKTVTDAFEGFTPAEGDKVVSQNDGFAIYENGAWVGTLGTLQPGKGYVYVSKDAGTKTLTL